MSNQVSQRTEGEAAPARKGNAHGRRDEARRLLIAECRAKGEAIKERAKATYVLPRMTFRTAFCFASACFACAAAVIALLSVAA
jgi:hypothetical protein